MQHVFSLHFSYRAFLPYYRGEVSRLEVIDTCGRTLWIHCRHFRRFVSVHGLHGWFCLTLGPSGEFIALDKCQSGDA